MTAKERGVGDGLDRRAFLALAASAAGAAAAGGCATNPVTGRSQLMFMSESGEIALDRENAPHQFSADYGVTRDTGLNAYVSGVGMEIAAQTHRPAMPYSFRAVNASAINAYAFPGGSIAVTRGILVAMEDEAELAALLGHELGHVSARHTAQRMTTGVLTEAMVAGLGAYLTKEKKDQYAALAMGLGGVGAGLLLARYSRENEREADALGMEYMARVNYPANGMVRLMDRLRKEQRRKPSAIEIMFASHPMSDERYETAVRRAGEQYARTAALSDRRERYMDRTAGVRALRPAIEALQQGDARMMAGKWAEAEQHYADALRKAPDDYAALLSMAKCQQSLKRPAEARRYVQRARAVYPDEAQALHVGGMAAIAERRYDAALEDFRRYERALPGNPNTLYFKGLCLDGMGRKREAAAEYRKYRAIAPGGEFVERATARLAEWEPVPTPVR